ncbi:MAG: hypothetical protein RBR88_01515 [Candidatus Saccharicenans sp.]|nr:hypothetical protein [Candidatus Saccharicenans sp.]
MLQLLLSFILGALVTWLITHCYYKKSTKIIDKLPEEIIKKLALDPREKLSIKDLNDLIDLRTRAFNKSGLDSYIACPKCGSKLIKERELIDVDVDYEPNGYGSAYPIYDNKIKCPKCGWKKYESELCEERGLKTEFDKNSEKK